jgi:beta-1,4-N-acetylglucosaminyltransferase
MVKRVFTTVGSTKFPDLINAVLSADTIQVLESFGALELSIQYGTDERLYHNLVKGLSTTISINGFDYSPSIDEEMKSADMIISHAGSLLQNMVDYLGSGSVLEALHMGKVLVVVPNASLMDNHQAEVAKALADSGYLIQSSPR